MSCWKSEPPALLKYIVNSKKWYVGRITQRIISMDQWEPFRFIITHPCAKKEIRIKCIVAIINRSIPVVLFLVFCSNAFIYGLKELFEFIYEGSWSKDFMVLPPPGNYKDEQSETTTRTTRRGRQHQLENPLGYYRTPWCSKNISKWRSISSQPLISSSKRKRTGRLILECSRAPAPGRLHSRFYLKKIQTPHKEDSMYI